MGGSSTFEFEGDSHVNHNECDTGADCREENDEEGLLHDYSHGHDWLDAVVVPRGLINLHGISKNNYGLWPNVKLT